MNHKNKFGLRTLVLLPILLLMASVTPTARIAHAAGIVVTTLADEQNVNGQCSLREAIINANTNSQFGSSDCAAGTGTDTITFSVSGSINLATLGYLAVGDAAGVTIEGGNTITLSGGNTTRLFYVLFGARLTLNNIILTNGYSGTDYGGAVYVNQGTLVLNNSTIQNSRTNGFDGGAIVSSAGLVTLNNSIVQGNTDYNAGAISSSGILTLTNSIVRNNTATTFGGALSLGGATTISNSQIYSNTVSNGVGGGIYIIGSGDVTINNSQIYSNRTNVGLNHNGGGIYNKGRLAVIQSNLSGNTAGDAGGAIYNYQNTATLTNVTFSGNSALAGGAFYNVLATATLTNATLSNNSASNGAGFNNNSSSTATLVNVTISGNQGTGFVNDTGTATLTNVTVNANTLYSFENGVYNYSNSVSKTLTLKNTIVANSYPGLNCSDVGSVKIASNGFNLSSDNSCTLSFNQVGDWNNSNAYLGALTNNGGPTLTHMIFPPSKAIDGGSACPSLDQRGIGRVGLACDIGAVEYQPGVPTPYLWLPLISR